MTKEDIAKVSYAVNRAYCESMGDFSFGPWEDAPEWQRAAHRAELKAWLAAHADQNKRSMTQQIMMILKNAWRDWRQGI